MDINSIIIPTNFNNITDEHLSFINKFKIFLSNNKIYIEYNIPLSNEGKGQACFIMNEFWEKYIYYIYINYLINNKNKISLYAFVHLIEQYFIWNENNNAGEAQKFKELIIDIIYKIYQTEEINQFLEMNKLNNIEELFAKYEMFIKYGNKNNMKSNPEIEVKLENGECICDLCKNENSFIKKMSEINKQFNKNVNVENLYIKAIYPQKEKPQENKELKSIISDFYQNEKNKDQAPKFSKTKTLQSNEYIYQYLAPKDIIKKENASKNVSVKSVKKETVAKERKEGAEEYKEPKENFIEITGNTKIYDFFKKEEKTEDITNEKKKQSKEKSSEKKNQNKNKRYSYKSKEEKNYKSKDYKKKEKSKINKYQKSKPRNRSYTRIYSDDESDSEEYPKNKSKASFIYPKRKKTKGKK